LRDGIEVVLAYPLGSEPRDRVLHKVQSWSRFVWGPGEFYLDGDRATEEMARARIALADARAAYPAEVERVAEALRPELEAGELRGWQDGDGDLPPGEAPYHRLEDEVALRYVATLDAGSASVAS
jgi:hypothetical protein